MGETLFVWPVRVCNIVVAAIFDFMTVKDWGRVEIVTLSFNMALLRANCALKENACTAG